MKETEAYLDLIGKHLAEHHAAVLVGAGFSRNAVKTDSDIPDSPTWDELANIFADKLAGSKENKKPYSSPLVMAERVEAVYGRSELDHLLLESIRDQDYLPSSLHRQLLRLPWSDIFTTNYDTLLERTSEEIAEKSFAVITSKADLIGSSGKTRIVKLHGSFPSHYPFIITSEDYRTYPQRFAPFVNTVQQSMLENTLCLIGFSGDDPNFEKWIGWMRDNLGEENAPNIYMLLHYQPPEAERLLLRRKKIIPVDLSQLAPGEPTALIYEKALQYLSKKVRDVQPQKWEFRQTSVELSKQEITLKKGLDLLKMLHRSYPGWITMPGGQLRLLRSMILSPAEGILTRCCAMSEEPSEEEIEYLYEYDWLRERALCPPFTTELKAYHKILDRHPNDHPEHRRSIQMSLLRDLRESGDWTAWEELHNVLQGERLYFDGEQENQLAWEECLCALARYQFRELKKLLDNWSVLPSMPVWCLRKAGLLAEYGDVQQAQELLRQAINSIRGRIAHQQKIDLALLSQESALMNLKGFVSQALSSHFVPTDDNGELPEEKIIDEQHSAIHAQYHVDWEEQDNFFSARMEAVWKPFQSRQVSQSFDFGKTVTSTHFGSDEETLLAFAFLRFREETGIPFRIRNVYSGSAAAYGAALRLARYAPLWSVLALVRSGKSKELGEVITRGVLSGWSNEEVDTQSQFYLDAILRANDELSPEDWFGRNSLARLAAEVLPEMLSELCSRCSKAMLNQTFDLVKTLYFLDQKKRLCYSRMPSLASRLFSAYTPEERRALIPTLLTFPLSIETDKYEERYFADPLEYLRGMTVPQEKQGPPDSLPEIDKLLEDYHPERKDAKAILDRLLYCLDFGQMTVGQREKLRNLVWKNGQLELPPNRLRTVCLKLPEPSGMKWSEYLAAEITKSFMGYSGKGMRPNNDIALTRELGGVSISLHDAFSAEQIASILSSLSKRVSSLTQNLTGDVDVMSIKSFSTSHIYQLQNSIWLLLASSTHPLTEAAEEALRKLVETAEQAKVIHHGLRSWWYRHSQTQFNHAKELGQCLGSVNEQRALWGYSTLSFAIRQNHMALLDDEQIIAGITTMSQQIAWCVPKQLSAALNVARLAVECRPEMLSKECLDLMLTGLSQLLEQTVITTDDTISMASSKGEARRNAAALAKGLYRAQLISDRPEILEEWMAVISNPEEYAEIRTV